ncbi:Clavaminate synthase-like protein [Durotheca rogersii]|uniref:Clavaminate synthase-like protein n=1 Tax=Durotheca rogersii TaxID=419775 RepID=UPI00221E9B45|nr:Clavaminate synthase-like protein [Durotheca rogersii]KAI5855093.1 Clavaminate synthase-like protein [Durotheca rogersii]
MPGAVTSVTPTASAPPGQPDIAYVPDYDKWQARAARRLKEGNLPKTLPEGYPAQLTGAMVWEGETVGDTYDWTYVLSDEQLAEIDRALEYFQGLGLALGHISAVTFPLPTLGAELRRLSAELHGGHGFFVVRGIRVDARTRAENVAIYVGLSAQVAPQRGRQDNKHGGVAADVVLGHIKNLSGPAAAAVGSPAYTADKQVFHTDSGDILALFALETSAAAGASKLASTWRVYNEIAATRPDLVHTLSHNWAMEDSFKETKKQYIERPLLHHLPATTTAPERIELQYGRRYFVGFGALPRRPTIPPITEAQAEALDALHFLSERFCVNTGFRKGDIQYINNLALLHARDGFTDTPEKTRHLLRLWLRDPEYAWLIPQAWEYRWEQLYGGVTPEKQVLPLEPFIRSAGNKAKQRPREGRKGARK